MAMRADATRVAVEEMTAPVATAEAELRYPLPPPPDEPPALPPPPLLPVMWLVAAASRKRRTAALFN